MNDEIPTKASAYDSVSKLLRLEDGYWEQITMLAIKESMKRRRRYSVNQLLHDTLTQALKLRPLDEVERDREAAPPTYTNRKRVASGNSVSVPLDPGGPRPL